jgi:hypothetical protein
MPVLRHELLRALHERLRPRTYLEIGVNDGRSLSLSRVRSVAIDPAFSVTSELRGDVHLVRATSDEFFARPDPLQHLQGRPIDLAFIDGMHLAEFALRDFLNVERYTSPASVIVLDDALPRDVDEAARRRHTKFWAGDVYKVPQALRRLRPDLVVLDVDTRPTGTCVVLLPDAGSRVLLDRYDELMAEMVVPDPQDVPVELLERKDAVDPVRLVESPIWSRLQLLRHRKRGTPDDVRSVVRDALESVRVPA